MRDLPAFGSVVYARDYRTLSDFYAKIANMKTREITDEYVTLEAPGYFLVVLQIPKRVADTIAIDSPPRRREETPIKLIFSVDSLEEARQRVTTQGGALNDQAREWAFHGVRRCDGMDPEGNIFQLQEC